MIDLKIITRINNSDESICLCFVFWVDLFNYRIVISLVIHSTLKYSKNLLPFTESNLIKVLHDSL